MPAMGLLKPELLLLARPVDEFRLRWPARREKRLGSDPLVHIQRGFVTAGVTHYLGGNARHRGVGWHGLQYYAAGANLGTATYLLYN